MNTTTGTKSAAVLSIASGPLVGPVLARVITILASRANLSIDRLNDAVLLGDTIAANSEPVVTEGRLRIAIDARASALEMRVGPLLPDGAAELRRASTMPGTGDVLDRLADAVRVESDGGVEYLLLDVTSPR